MGVLIRQELVINTLFWTFGKCPLWFPLRIRRLAAKIYHLGGVHSGCGMAAFLWFAFFNVAVVNAFQSGALEAHHNAIPVVTVIIDLLLLGIIVMAHPAIRSRTHDWFELVHRFAGWTTVGFFWTLFGLLIDARVKDPASHVNLQEALVQSPVFWTLIIVTVSIALPWVWLRKVPVHAEPCEIPSFRIIRGKKSLLGRGMTYSSGLDGQKEN